MRRPWRKLISCPQLIQYLTQFDSKLAFTKQMPTVNFLSVCETKQLKQPAIPSHKEPEHYVKGFLCLGDDVLTPTRRALQCSVPFAWTLFGLGRPCSDMLWQLLLCCPISGKRPSSWVKSCYRARPKTAQMNYLGSRLERSKINLQVIEPGPGLGSGKLPSKKGGAAIAFSNSLHCVKC